MAQRYQGESLPRTCRIAVISNDAIGNFAAATPLLQMLRAKCPAAHLAYYCGSRASQLLAASDLFDDWFPLHGTHPRAISERIDSQAPYDLVFNMESTVTSRFATAALAGAEGKVCGPCLDAEGRKDLPFQDDARGDLWRDMAWIAPDLTSRYPFLESGFIGELFCRLAYIEGPVPGYRFPVATPPMPIPDVLIATSASLPEKLWPLEKWVAALTWIRDQGKSVGLIGAPPKDQGRYWQGSDLESGLVAANLVQDLRGKLTLPEVVGALGTARAVLTLDNGILHLAVPGGRPIVGLFREGIHRLWAPPAPQLSIVLPPPGGMVAEIEPEEVIERMRQALA